MTIILSWLAKNANHLLNCMMTSLTKKISIIINVMRKEDSCHSITAEVIFLLLPLRSPLLSTKRLRRNKCWRILKEIPVTGTCAFLCNCSADVVHFHSTVLRRMENYNWNKQTDRTVGVLNRIFQLIQKI